MSSSQSLPNIPSGYVETAFARRVEERMTLYGYDRATAEVWTLIEMAEKWAEWKEGQAL